MNEKPRLSPTSLNSYSSTSSLAYIVSTPGAYTYSHLESNKALVLHACPLRVGSLNSSFSQINFEFDFPGAVCARRAVRGGGAGAGGGVPNAAVPRRCCGAFTGGRGRRHQGEGLALCPRPAGATPQLYYMISGTFCPVCFLVTKMHAG